MYIMVKAILKDKFIAAEGYVGNKTKSKNNHLSSYFK